MFSTSITTYTFIAALCNIKIWICEVSSIINYKGLSYSNLTKDFFLIGGFVPKKTLYEAPSGSTYKFAGFCTIILITPLKISNQTVYKDSCLSFFVINIKVCNPENVCLGMYLSFKFYCDHSKAVAGLIRAHVNETDFALRPVNIIQEDVFMYKPHLDT